MSKRSNFLFIVIMVVLLVAFPFFLEKLLHTPSQFGFVDGNNYSEWVGYYSSYISGLITLLGVYWTIRFTQEQNQETAKEENKRFATQLRLENYPIFDLQITSGDKKESGAEICYKSQVDCPIELPLKFKIENTGQTMISSALIEFPGNDECVELIKNPLFPHNQKSTYLFLKVPLSELEKGSIYFYVYFQDILRNRYKSWYTFELKNNNLEFSADNIRLQEVIFEKAGNIDQQSTIAQYKHIDEDSFKEKKISIEKENRYSLYWEVINKIKKHLDKKVLNMDIKISKLIDADKKNFGCRPCEKEVKNQVYSVNADVYLAFFLESLNMYFKIAKCNVVFEVDFKKKTWKLKDFKVDKEDSALNAFQRLQLKFATNKFKDNNEFEGAQAEEKK